MSVEKVIEFDNVSKLYRVGAGHHSLRSAVSGFFEKIRTRGGSFNAAPWIHALRNVSFSVSQGEALGIMGHNGAGKTTALKLMSRITLPTQGCITIRGRVSSLIELGAGFHPEMTGRENVYLNGVIMGMTRREVAHRFDSIVSFAEVEDFIDTPVKRYSSGMYVRLAFAVAAHVDPELLLVDEVLAVGDIAYRAKCYRRMAELREKGTTVVLVSHDVYAIRDVCDRALLLWQGGLLEDGKPEPVIDAYLVRMENREVELAPGARQVAELEPGGDRMAPSDTGVKIANVTFCDEAGRSLRTIQTGRPLSIGVRYGAQVEIRRPIVRVDFYRSGRLITGYSTAYDGESLSLGREGEVWLDIQGIHLPTGVYSVSVVISDTYEYNLLDVHHQAYPLQVVRAPNSRGDMALPHAWHHRLLDTSEEGKV